MPQAEFNARAQHLVQVSAGQQIEDASAQTRPVKIARHTEPEAFQHLTVTKKRRGSMRGTLRVFMNLPPEVFLEVATHLRPLDLLALARTNKFFRHIFMSRSIIHIWHAAERNVAGLPPCPKELCEPQYAALMFTKNCSMCGVLTTCHMNDILLVRLCVPCRDAQAMLASRIEVGSLVPSSRYLLPPNIGKGASLCLLKDVNAVKEELKKLRLIGGEKETQRWIKERERVMKNRNAELAPLRTFIYSVEAKRRERLHALKCARADKIGARLNEHGWLKVDFQGKNEARNDQWQSLVFTAIPLTDQGWNKLLPVLTPMLELNRGERLEREALLHQRKRKFEIAEWIREVRGKPEIFVQMLDPWNPEFPEDDVASVLGGVSNLGDAT